MRIVRRESPVEIEIKCSGDGNGGGGCGVVMGIEQKDIHHTQSHARDESTSYATICCPECMTLTDIHRMNLPTGWTKWQDQTPTTPKKIQEARASGVKP